MLLCLCTFFWIGTIFVSSCSATLEVLQEYQPVPIPHNGNLSCHHEVLLMQHVFGSSYGHPFIGHYEPPQCDFNFVRINLTVTSRGRQFDRLALMYLGDSEVFRTSTAEPTTDGIVWTYIKDMSHYRSLWKEQQKLVFDLGNLINDVYTASFTVTLTALFSHGDQVKTADRILPISAMRSSRNSSSAFTVPTEKAKIQHKIPPTASRAVVSISACGQSTEEFWWSNVLSSDIGTFNSTVGELYGYSPFREIQLYIDGVLAGVVWPFPVIFTGGVVPGFWRPIVGIDTFDLREPEIDISPFLPQLTDGQLHSFEIKVVGLDVFDELASFSDTVGSYWVVTGNIFLYLDASGKSPRSSRFNRRGLSIIAPTPHFTVTRDLIKNQNGGNETLLYSVTAERTLLITSHEFSWNQTLSYSNFGVFQDRGITQANRQQTSGSTSITLLGLNKTPDQITFGYPLYVNSTTRVTGEGQTIDARMRRGLYIEATDVTGISTYTLTSGPSRLHTEQWGSAFYQSKNDSSVSFGDTTDVFESTNIRGSYRRTVHAVNGSIVSDTDARGGRDLGSFS